MSSVTVATFKAAPGAVMVRLCRSILSAVLPILTAYFAALTTTALAEAYSGDSQASQRVILYVSIAAFLGVVTAAWKTIERYVLKNMQYVIESATIIKMYSHFHSIDFW